MIQTVKINIGGYAFNVESDAQQALEAYLEAIKNSSAENGRELAEDVEERIAEILLEKCSPERIVTLSMVKSVKEIIGGPEMFGAGNSAPQSNNFSFRDTRLYRNPADKLIAGVCSGLSLRFDIDVVYIRLAFCLLMLCGIWCESFFVIMSIAYIILWICIPRAKTVEERCRMKKEPLSYNEFYHQAATPAPERTPGFLKASGRLLKFCMGVLLLCGGLAIFTSDIAFAMLPFHHGLKHVFWNGFYYDFFSFPFPIGEVFPVLVVVMLGLMGLWFAYNGIMLIFDIEPPRWKPGLVLFVAWLMSIFAIAAVVIIQAGKAGFLPWAQ